MELLNSHRYDILDLSYRDPQNIKEREYTSIRKMYHDLTWDMTHMGNTFFKKNSYKIFDIEEYRKQYNTENFIQNAIYFDCFIGNNFYGFFQHLDMISMYQGNKKRQWDVIVVGAYSWYDYVYNSPDKYNDEKKDVYTSHGMYSTLHLNRYMTYIKQSLKGNLSYQKYKKYHASIQYTSGLNIYLIGLISAIFGSKSAVLIGRRLLAIKHRIFNQ